MERLLGELRDRIEDLSREVSEIERRLSLLEARERSVSGHLEDGAAERAALRVPPPAAGPAASAPAIPARSVALVGRTLVVLGGAYLLRAISDAALVPPLGGAVAGLVYAAWWLVQADRSAAVGRRLSAAFHGFAAVIVAYPLIWETTVRFGFLTAPAAAAALLGFLALGLALAWRHDLEEMAWTVTLVTLVTTLGLLLGTHQFLPFSSALFLIAASLEVIAFRGRWLGLRWPAAIVLDLAVLFTVSSAVGQGGLPREGTTLAAARVTELCLAVPVLYLGSVGARTLLSQRSVTAFEMVQVAAALLVGLGGAARVVVFEAADPGFIGALGLLLGSACYAAAFACVEPCSGRRKNFHFFAALAGLLVLTGSRIVLGGGALVLVWSALAAGAVALGRRFDRTTLRFHGAVFAVAAATAAGLIASAADGLLADFSGDWRAATPAGAAVALVAVACYAFLVVWPGKAPTRWPDLLPQAILGGAVVWSAAGAISGWLGRCAIDGVGPTAGAAFVAAIRTGVIATLAVALAWAGRRWSRQELTWLVYPLLVGGGLKLLWEDFQHHQPVALFLSFALYGGALIATPRLMRRVPPSSREDLG